MTDCDKIPTLTDIEDSKSAMDDIQSFTYSGADNFVDAKGLTRDTVNGRLKKMGYTVPIVYTVSIVFGINDSIKTVEEGNVIYAPKPSALPFTTSGTFIGDDDARFFVVQGLTNEQLINDLSQSYEFKTVELMKTSNIIFPSTKKITVKERITGSGGELTFEVFDTISVTPNGIDTIESTGVPTQSFKQRYDDEEGLPQMQKVMSSLEADVGGVIMLVVGDSTGNETNEWVYLLLADLADKYTSYTFEWRVWNVALEVYDAPVTISTGSGANTLTCYNASIPGEEATFVKGEIYPTITDVQAFLTLVSFGHNGLNDPENQRTELAAFTCAMANDYPDRPIVLVGQNPQTDNSNMDNRVKEFKELAAEQGYGFIDVYSAFNRFAKPLGDYMSDTVHPNLLGSHLWKSTVKKAFGMAEKGATGLPKNNMSEMVLYNAADSSIIEGWTLGGGAVVSKDSNSGFYETAGGSTKLTSPGVGNINKEVISVDDIVQWREKWVTLAVRVRVPTGEVDDSGLIALFDGTDTILTFKGGPQGVDFYWQVVSIKINPAATNLRAFIYADRGATGGTVFIDRVTVSAGRSPKDVIPMDSANFRGIVADSISTNSVSTKDLSIENAIDSLEITNELDLKSTILMKNIATPPATSNAGEFRLYFNNGRFRHIDNAGTIVIID